MCCGRFRQIAEMQARSEQLARSQRNAKQRFHDQWQRLGTELVALTSDMIKTAVPMTVAATWDWTSGVGL